MGKKGTGCVLTLVDRKTRLLVAGKLPGKHAQGLADKTIGLLRDKPCRTVTFDNGLEFASVSGYFSGAGHCHLLRSSPFALGAWNERKHQWAPA